MKSYPLLLQFNGDGSIEVHIQVCALQDGSEVIGEVELISLVSVNIIVLLLRGGPAKTKGKK